MSHARIVSTTFAAAALASLGLMLVGACSAPDARARVDAIGPDETQFASVLPPLVRRCGSLDCHGTPYRNMRLYGYGGQRLPGRAFADGGFADAATTSVAPDGPVTPTDTEIAASWQSVVGLEPEIMHDVVKANGGGSDRLTFVRKGRGEEAHKGDQRYCRGDSMDLCIQSWLRGAVDGDACSRAGDNAPNSLCAVP